MCPFSSIAPPASHVWCTLALEHMIPTAKADDDGGLTLGRTQETWTPGCSATCGGTDSGWVTDIGDPEFHLSVWATHASLMGVEERR